MALKLTSIWITVLGGGLLAANVCAGDAPALKTREDRLSYGLGVEMGRNFKLNGIRVDEDLLVKGLKDGLSGAALLMSETEFQATMTGFRQELIRTRARDKKVAALENKQEGDAFLAGNKTKEGVKTLANGLQYKILKAGKGSKPTDADTVVVNYRGSLIKGTEFDSSYRTGKPAIIEIRKVIPGWRQALLLMPVGSKWQLFIPPELAYREYGAGNNIGPNATLIFEVELISIQERVEAGKAPGQ